MKLQILRKTGLWWIRNRRTFKILFWVNILIWFWPVYLGMGAYKEIVVPNELASARYERAEPIAYEAMPSEVKDTLNYYADLFGVDKKLVYKITQCESGGNPDRIGYEKNVPTNSFGLWQFQMGTWAEFSAKYKCRNCDIRDYRDQTLIAIQMIRDGYASRWTCFK